MSCHFTDATFGDFFNRHSIDIHGHKYQTYGTSKAKKMRAFHGEGIEILLLGASYLNCLIATR